MRWWGHVLFKMIGFVCIVGFCMVLGFALGTMGEEHQ